jgi:purine-binding chemotaxis protein CheW
VVIRVEGALVFLPASVVREIAPVPQITRVPGAPTNLLGIALHGGELVPVIAVGASREAMIVCTCAGENVGLVGFLLVNAGVFEVDDAKDVMFAGEAAKPLDLPSIYATVQAGRWSGRWGG